MPEIVYQPTEYTAWGKPILYGRCLPNHATGVGCAKITVPDVCADGADSGTGVMSAAIPCSWIKEAEMLHHVNGGPANEVHPHKLPLAHEPLTTVHADTDDEF